MIIQQLNFFFLFKSILSQGMQNLQKFMFSFAPNIPNPHEWVLGGKEVWTMQGREFLGQGTPTNLRSHLLMKTNFLNEEYCFS